jgi:hypothetical protein
VDNISLPRRHMRCCGASNPAVGHWRGILIISSLDDALLEMSIDMKHCLVQAVDRGWHDGRQRDFDTMKSICETGICQDHEIE